MNKRERDKFKKLLLKERQHLTEGIRTLEADTLQSGERDTTGDLSSFAESGTDANDRDTALRLASGESEMLRQVEEALNRIEDASYGICIDCEKPIPVKRLEVFPSAQRCVQCKSAYEKRTHR